MIAALAWRNLWRQKLRTILSLAGIAFTAALLVFVLSFQVGVYSAMITNVLRIFDGFAELQARGYAADPDPHKTIGQPEKLSAEIRTVDGVGAASPRVLTFAILANGARSYGVAVIGIDPATEPQVSTLSATVRQGRYLEPSDTNAAVIGDVLARDLKLGVGDRVSLLGAALDGSVATDVLKVAGIFHSGMGDLDRQMLFMPLARAQETFAMGDRANVIALAGPSLSSVDGALPNIANVARGHGVSVADWESLEPSLKDTITLKVISAGLMYVTLVVVVVFIILNTLLMSVLERTHEFGVLLALGMRPRLVGAMVWAELIFLALIGNGLGIAIGAGITLWLERVGITLPGMDSLLAQYGFPGRLYPALSTATALAGPGAIFVSILVAGLVPYFHVQRLEPVSAMRSA